MANETEIRTFLIADIRGYTRYTREFGDDAASAVATRFAAIVRNTVPEFDGELLELRGDEALCVFGSARQALRAAVAIQRQLRAPEMGAPFPLAVGIGLDAGEAVPTEGGYRGAALNTAARLCAIAGRGEILATDRLVGLTGPVAGLRWDRTRAVRLKGVADPQRIARIDPDEAIPPPPPDRDGRSRRPILTAAVIIGLALIAAIAAAIVISGRSKASTVRVYPNSVVEIDRADRKVVADVRLSSPPSAVVASPERVWVARPDAQAITWFSPNALRPRGRGVSVTPVQLTLDRQSPVLYDPSTGEGLVLNPGTFREDAFKVPLGRCFGPGIECYGGGLAVAGNDIWVGTTNSERIWRVDAQTLVVDRERPVPHVLGDQLAWGMGSLWAYGNAGQWVYKVDTDARRVVERYTTRLSTAPASPPPLATVPIEGQVWALDPADGRVIVLDTIASLADTLPLRSGLTGIAVQGQWGWIASNDGRVYQVSVFDGRVKHVYRLPRPAQAIAVQGNRVWVAVS